MASSDNEDPADLFGEGDLFGDEDEPQSDKERALSDRELDSGDDEDRNDRAGDLMDGVDQEVDENDRQARVMDADFPRQAVPRPSDGEVCFHRTREPYRTLLITPVVAHTSYSKIFGPCSESLRSVDFYNTSGRPSFLNAEREFFRKHSCQHHNSLSQESREW